jgi:GT2 family glycosyltransferase
MKDLIKRLLGGASASARGSSATTGARLGFEPPEHLRVRPGGPVPESALPRVSIVILNLNGRHHLQPCFDSLRQLDYPADRLEVVLVDNGSDDGSVEEMRSKHAWVRLHVNDRNLGFSVGCNQGAELSPRAEVLVFLNNDMRVAQDWLKELVAPLVRRECVAATSKMWSWDGKVLNSAGGGMNFHGLGIQRGYEEPPSPAFDVPMKTLFACGGAMAMDAAEFRRVGGFDGEFFAYYEDVDLGWRTWLAGGEVHYVPSSQCWHHHSSTSRRLPIEMVRLIQVRNPVLACFKNYDDEHLRQVLPAILSLFVRRMWMNSGLHEKDAEFRIEQATNPASSMFRRMLDKAQARFDETIDFRRIGAADLVAINDLLGNWDHWMRRRKGVQALRRRPDSEIFSLFQKPFRCIEGERGYVELQKGLVEFHGLDRTFPPDNLPAPR